MNTRIVPPALSFILGIVGLNAAEPAAPGVRMALLDKTAHIESDRLRIEFNLSTGTYSGIDKSSGVALFRDASFRLDPGRRAWKEPPYEYRAEDAGAVRDEGGVGRRLRFWVLPGKSYLPARFLNVTVYADRPYVVLGWGVRNDFPFAIRVCRAEVLANGRLFRLVDLQRVWTDASHFEPEMASRMGLRWYKQGKVFR